MGKDDIEFRGSIFNPVKYYGIAAAFLILGLLGIDRLFLKADLPFKYDSDLMCKYDYGTVNSGDVIQKVDGFTVNNKFQLEFILDHKKVGDYVRLNVLYGSDSVKEVSVQLVNYCSTFFILISFIIGLAFWLSSVFVISKKRDEKSARLIYWIFLIYSIAIMTATSPSEGTSYSVLLRIAYEVTYLLGVVLFIHFTFVFPQERLHNKKIGLTIIYLPPVIISILLSVSIIYALDNVNSEWLYIYQFMSKIVRIYLVLGIVFCTINLILSYRKFTAAPDKRKIEWIFWGVSAGVIPFLVLWVIPEILGLPTLPEEIPLSFLILVPVSFVIAVLKYRLFDIEFIIKRSIVYTVLSAFVLLLYFGLVAAITSVSYGMLGESNIIISLVVTFMIAFLFNPARVKVKGIVDKTFYRVKYDINKAVGFFAREVKECNTLGELGSVTIREIQKLIPVSKIALALADESGHHLTILSQNNFDELSLNIAAFRIKKIDASFMLPFALADRVEHGIEINASLDNILKRWDINLVIPFILESKEVIGALILGNKLSNMRYSYSDFELLNIIATQIAFAVKRLQLQEKLIFESIEKVRLEDLNNLKSFFVSRVSHDLKTPLTSIIMFSKILQSKKQIRAGKKAEYLKIIEGESTRLTRLIDNLLNFAKIEKGIKEYKLEEVEINGIIKEVINLVKYELKMHKFRLGVHYCKNKCFILADSDAVIEALLNIISNSIKYSAEKKKITITAFEENGYASIKISDEGRGIPEASLKIIFEPFYRSKDAFFNRVNGTGLGLAIVKHIMESHKGKINVESELGIGTSFALSFPEKKN